MERKGLNGRLQLIEMNQIVIGFMYMLCDVRLPDMGHSVAALSACGTYSGRMRQFINNVLKHLK